MNLENSPKIDSKPKHVPIDFIKARTYLKKDQDCRMVALTSIKSNKGSMVHRGTHVVMDWSSAVLMIEEQRAVPLDYLMDRQLLILPMKGHA